MNDKDGKPSTKVRLKINDCDPRLIREFWIGYGLATANAALEAVEMKNRTAGFGYAMTIVEKAAAEQRAVLNRFTLAEAAKLGADLSRVSIVTEFDGAEAVLTITDQEDEEAR